MKWSSCPTPPKPPPYSPDNSEEYPTVQDLLERNAEDVDSNNVRSAFASSLATALATSITHPLTLVKYKIIMSLPIAKKQPEQISQVQLRLSKHSIHNVFLKQGTFWHFARELYLKDGVPGFFKHHNATQFIVISEAILLFLAFEHLEQFIFNLKVGEHLDTCNFICGGLSGAMASSIIHPLDYMMLRHRAFRKWKTRLGSAESAYQLLPIKQGLIISYKGIWPALLLKTPQMGFTFMFYNSMCNYMLLKSDYTDRQYLNESNLLLAGATAGLLANAITYPLNLIKIRMERSGFARHLHPFNPTCNNSIQCFRTTVIRDGYLGLYRGFVSFMIKNSLNTAVQFSVYDKLKRWADKNL